MTSRSRRRVDAVLFDFDHTLGVDNHLEEIVLRELSQRYCAAPFADERIVASLALFRQGTLSLAGMLRSAFEDCACDDDIVVAYKAIALSLVPSQLVAMAGAVETLAALRARDLTVAVLSNGWTELQLAKAAAIGFDGPVFVSESIGVWKPDVRAFEIASEELGISRERSMYVGDSPLTDVVGSKSAGMVAVWADLEGHSYPEGTVAPDFTITSLDQVLQLV